MRVCRAHESARSACVFCHVAPVTGRRHASVSFGGVAFAERGEVERDWALRIRNREKDGLLARLGSASAVPSRHGCGLVAASYRWGHATRRRRTGCSGSGREENRAITCFATLLQKFELRTN